MKRRFKSELILPHIVLVGLIVILILTVINEIK